MPETSHSELESNLALGIATAELGDSGSAHVYPYKARTDLAQRWRSEIRRYLVVADSVTILAVTYAVQWAWLGGDSAVAQGSKGSGVVPTYSALSLAIAIVWLASLTASGSRNHRILGAGAEEYHRVFKASTWVFGLLAVVALLARYEVARGYIALVFPLGTGGLLFARWAMRSALNRWRGQGRMVSRVLLLGSPEGCDRMVTYVDNSPRAGLEVVGMFHHRPAHKSFRPSDVIAMASSDMADTVVVTSSAHLEPAELRELRWSMDDAGLDLVVAPPLLGLAGSRVHTRPIDGLPLLHVDGARYSGSMRSVKSVLDRVGAAVAILLLSPVMVALAIAVKTTSRGPAIYRQERVGAHGEIFTIWKFRSMRVGADEELMHRLREDGRDDVPLFKLDEDDRITSLGSFMRRWSLDELPQLFNVISGEMSLVGPRPQRPAEVALYSTADHRRLRVRPGLTGLWQVSGRSDLPWVRAVELDLYYVENWSLTFDFLLLLRTLSAVVRRHGAR